VPKRQQGLSLLELGWTYGRIEAEKNTNFDQPFTKTFALSNRVER
jgi:hypothetical protein